MSVAFLNLAKNYSTKDIQYYRSVSFYLAFIKYLIKLVCTPCKQIPVMRSYQLIFLESLTCNTLKMALTYMSVIGRLLANLQYIIFKVPLRLKFQSNYLHVYDVRMSSHLLDTFYRPAVTNQRIFFQADPYDR